ncbi:fibronectin type III domain-containing protein, partial [Dehalogenimonas sp. THU2]|uniref:beta strand repeat-containing protein n=1 Tax=Dehalogenimonas sp. THU2 TaxID=3151121 RepID=UPI0032189E21
MKKFNKFFSVLLTAALLTGMLVSTALPVSAGTQVWSDFTVPSTTNRVLSTTITDVSAFAQSMVDGALYASVNEGGWKLIKSTDGGRTWATTFTTTGLPAVAAVAIVPSKTEADVVFLADATTMYKSMDGGKTWTTIVGAPAGDAITALDVAIFGGRYIAVVGTNAAGVSDAGVYFWDSNDVFNNLNPVGTTTFGFPVLALAMAHTFGTDRAVVAVGNNGANAVVRVNVNGGAWGATVLDTVITSGVPTAADIAFPTDFNAISNPIYFTVVSGPTGGAYRMVGNTFLSIDAGLTWNNISVNGAFNAGAANVMIGSSAGTVKKSTNSGVSFTPVNLRSVAVASSFVLFDIGYASNQKAYILNAGEALNVSIDGMMYFNQWSLIDEASQLATMDMAANGDIYAVTSPTTTLGMFDTFTLTSVAGGGFFAGDVFTLTSAAAGDATVVEGTGTVNVVVSGGGSAAYLAGTWTVTFTAASEVATVTALTAGTVTWANGTDSPAAAETVDPNNSMTVTNVSGETVTMDMNPVVVTLVGAVSPAGPITFTTAGEVSAVFAATAVGDVTWTATAGATNATGAIVYDPNTTAAVAAGTITGLDNNPVTVGGKLWRYFGGVWERIDTGLNINDNVFVSPNYATDKTVMIANMGTADAIMVSGNNGNSFTAMLSAPGSFDGTPNVIESVFVVNNTTVIVGSADGVITKNTSPFFWTETNVFGVGSAMDVTDIKQASNGDLLAVATKAGSTKVAKSTDGGATWTVITANNISYGNGAKAYVAPANDYAATGNYFVAVFDKTYRGKTEIASGGMGSATGVVTAPGIGNSDEGNGVAYISDTGSDIERARGKMDWVDNLASFGSGVAKLFVTVEADGNKLWALGVNGNIRVYTDTMAKGITGVAASNIVSTTSVFLGIVTTTNTATISWDAMPNATRYTYAVATGAYEKDLMNLSSAVVANGSITGTTANLTGLAADTAYYVSVWADRTGTGGANPMSSFRGTSSFTTVVGAPTPAMNLAPAAGATNVPVKPTFDWADVPGAVSYEVWVDTKADFSTAVKATTPISAYA